MMNYKTYILLLFILLIYSCKKDSNLHIPKEIDDLGYEFNESYENNSLIKSNLKDGKIKLNDTLKIKVNANKKDLSFELKTNNIIQKILPLEGKYNSSEEYKFLMKELTLGVKELIIKNDSLSEKINFTLLNDKTPKIYDYEIINVFDRASNFYTQGFEFHNGVLYESTGLRGKSKLLKVDFKNGNVLKEYKLPSKYFAEGITILNEKIYQLSWTNKLGFIYDVNTFDKINSFKYEKSLEGWGICNDGNKLYKSDGTEKIWTLNAESQIEEGYIEIYTNKNKVIGLNELEWIDGKIYANRYQFKGMAIIDPKNGAVEGVVDLSPLEKKVTQHRKLDVINGIAFNKKRNSIFVTGKMWDKIFEIRIIERK